MQIPDANCCFKFWSWSCSDITFVWETHWKICCPDVSAGFEPLEVFIVNSLFRQLREKQVSVNKNLCYLEKSVMNGETIASSKCVRINCILSIY